MKLNHHSLRLGFTLAVAALIAGCAALPGGIPKGTTIEQARNGLQKPTAEYGFKNGFRRLEFDQGKQTYMLDFDTSGILTPTGG